MEARVDWKDHPHLVGCIITNLQALETVLRRFLMEVNGERMEFPKPEDSDAAETQLTGYLSLNRLVGRFNEALKDSEKNFAVDEGVVRIRDAFAHGRLITYDQFPTRLWKFGVATKDHRVPIEFCEELTVEWLTGKSNWIERQKQNVVDCFKARGYHGLR
jgi:hypothetical protein